MPITSSTHFPCSSARPSSSIPRSTKKSIAVSRSCTTTRTLSIRRSVTDVSFASPLVGTRRRSPGTNRKGGRRGRPPSHVDRELRSPRVTGALEREVRGDVRREGAVGDVGQTIRRRRVRLHDEAVPDCVVVGGACVRPLGQDALVVDTLELGGDGGHVGPGQVTRRDCLLEQGLDRVLPGPTGRVRAAGAAVLARIEPVLLGGGAHGLVPGSVGVPATPWSGALVDTLEERHGLAALEGHVPGRAGAQDLELLVATL